MTSNLNAAFVQIRQATLRREAGEARLAQIARKTTEPRLIGVIKAARLSIRALTDREAFGFADGFLRPDDRDRRPSGLQEDDDFRWRWTA